MKITFKTLAALLVLLGSTSPALRGDEPAWMKAPPESVKAWDDLTFGLFMHWDMSSLLGVEISWAMQNRVDVTGDGFIPNEVYNNLYRSFNPQQFDADAIVKTAKDAGMRYIVFTAKHHGGFCMFDSALTDYDIMNTAFRRDVVKELAEATRKAGLAFGIYYSQPDWHHPDFLKKDWDAYRSYYFGQVRELCTHYGRIDIIFFDGLSYGADQFRPNELFKMIRELQPNVVINNRCGVQADYDTPEQVVGAFKNDRPWETCMTIGTSWSWKVGENLKSAAESIRVLVMTAGSGGNLLYNVGPMPTGQIEPRQAAILKEVGDWLKVKGESVYALNGGPYKPAGWGACTSKDHSLYLHVLSFADCPQSFPALPTKIQSITHLDGRAVKFSHDANGLKFEIPENERDSVDTILKVTLDPAGPPAHEITPVIVPTRSLARSMQVSSSHAADSAARLVDDDPSTIWSPGEKNCWVEVDLGADKKFNRIDIREEGHAWEVRTKDFEILVRSDGAPESDWKSIEHGSSIGATYTKSFSSVTGRYIRLKINDSGVLPHFSELQVYDN